jgi:hypothetical protein
VSVDDRGLSPGPGVVSHEVTLASSKVLCVAWAAVYLVPRVGRSEPVSVLVGCRITRTTVHQVLGSLGSFLL